MNCGTEGATGSLEDVGRRGMRVNMRATRNSGGKRQAHRPDMASHTAPDMSQCSAGPASFYCNTSVHRGRRAGTEEVSGGGAADDWLEQRGLITTERNFFSKCLLVGCRGGERLGD